ncbi:hypothetical protein MIND_00991900 [Mycena indigotica]|uniref:Uncharacterized protein n=1 Tax=Mycena indigotica TaxID=2126181 RepID=A0A8H6VUM4_9AGAR|nr:uncharacterized protein MIND_00991900 [Mycena indigotica]KAF7294554.1 hypothetical protein MIND_00991900 [Mycena indigotica]
MPARPWPEFTIDQICGTFDLLEHTYRSWMLEMPKARSACAGSAAAMCARIPPGFQAGLPDAQLPDSDDSDGMSTASMSLFSVATFMTPPRHLLPEELARDPNAPSDDEDDPDSEAEKELKRRSVRDLKLRMKSVETWTRKADGLVVDEKSILNDDEVAQVDEEFKEEPRTMSSVELDKPDYLQVPGLLKRKRGS